MNSSNKSVENKDLIQKILEMLEERLRLNQHRMVDYDDEEIDEDGEPHGHWDRGPGSVKFVWVKGHAKDQGNNAADELAVNGARVARELGEDVELD
jgi:ribonuclease HI